MKMCDKQLTAEFLSDKALQEFSGSDRPLSIGNDIVAVRRIADLMARRGSRFIERCFTAAEIEYCRSKAEPAVHFAGRWAAKEAVYKALRLKWNRPFGWKEIEIAPPSPGPGGDSASSSGPPQVNLADKLLDSLSVAAGEGPGAKRGPPPRIIVSIAHCSDYAFATALAVFDDAEAHLQ